MARRGLKDKGFNLELPVDRPAAGRLDAAADKSAAVSPHSGHRERVRKRFAVAGPDVFADYELLELALFPALPRQDTKPIAKALLARFGSFADVLNAPPGRLKEVDGVGDAAVTQLKVMRAAGLRLMREGVMHKPILSTWNAVLDYCRASMAYETQEQFRILFLDKKNRLIADEIQQKGTVDHTPVYVREVVKRALEHASSAIILVHNHPTLAF